METFQRRSCSSTVSLCRQINWVIAEKIETLKIYFEQNPKYHVTQAARLLCLRYGAIWRIFEEKSKMKPHLTLCLGPANKESRCAAFTFWLSFEEEWFQRVIWSDENWFVLKQSPNKQTYWHWALSNPRRLIECKKAHGKKSDGLDGGCGRANPPCYIVWRIGKFKYILGASTQKHYLGFSEEILVPARWSQLPRDGRMPRFSAIKIWRKNNFTPNNSPLAPLSSGLVTSRFFLLVSSYGKRH